MTEPMINRIGCVASVRAWRSEAAMIRELAERGHLPEANRQCLLGEADAADRQVDSRLDASHLRIAGREQVEVVLPTV
jgi:hypothetical protein